MKVKELIDILQQVEDQEMSVYILQDLIPKEEGNVELKASKIHEIMAMDTNEGNSLFITPKFSK
jgi:hypothetical protein